MSGTNLRWPRLALMGLLLLLPLLVSAAAPPRPFVSGSYQALLDARRGSPFLLIFWSLDCPPCHHELAMLGELKREFPELPLVLVATDAPQMARQVTELLAQKGLAAVESWLYADEFGERLRFEVDRSWYGELPRSYLFDATHQRRAISGVLGEAEVRGWLAQQVTRREAS